LKHEETFASGRHVCRGAVTPGVSLPGRRRRRVRLPRRGNRDQERV